MSKILAIFIFLNIVNLLLINNATVRLKIALKD